MADTLHQAQRVAPKPTARKKKRKKAGRIIKICVTVLLVAALGGFAYWYFTASQTTAAGTGDVYMLQPVRYGTLSKTVYGSGMIQAANQPSILAGASGTVTELHVDVGDAIRAGQVLLTMENQDLDSEIHSLEYSLWEKDISIQSAATGTEVTGVKAPVSGRVMQVNVMPGDDALAKYREHGSVVILSTDGRMKVDFDVLAGTILSLGDDVSITGEGIEMSGTITELYMQGTKATATILSDQLPMDAEVSILLGDAPIGTGRLEINKPLAVSAHGGTVENVQVAVGDTVSQKMTLLTLSDAPISLEIENLRMQRESIAQSLQTALEQRENLIVIAPSDGVISGMNVAAGDSAQSGTVLMSYVQGEDMVLSIAVDELDVVEVTPGQPVQIRVDALPDLALQGSVEKIAPVGTGSGGVSSYDVSLNFSAENTGVKPGMNASGEVEVASVADALYIPVEALMTVGNQQFVMVYEQAQSGDGTATASTETRTPGEGAGEGMRPAGATGQGQRAIGGEDAGQGRQNTGEAERQRTVQSAGTVGSTYGNGAQMPSTATQAGTLRAVETGIRNDDSVQITSGLQAGEIVMYQNTGSSTGTSRTSTMVMGASGGMGGMSGISMRPGG